MRTRLAAAFERWTVAQVFAVGVFIAVAALSVVQRWPYLGKMGEIHQQWLMGSTVKFVDNWREDGIFADRFLMLEYPRSIETPTVSTRQPYPSYLPGAPL